MQQKTCNLVCNIAVKRVEWRCCHFTTRFKPVNNLICCKTGFMWVVKRTTFLFNLFCSYVAKQVACFLLPIFPYLNLSNAHALIQDGRYPPILCPSLVQISLSCIREVYCIPLICKHFTSIPLFHINLLFLFWQVLNETRDHRHRLLLTVAKNINQWFIKVTTMLFSIDNVNLLCLKLL